MTEEESRRAGEVGPFFAERALLAHFRVVTELGCQLASELDPSALLPRIVSAARRLTRSEAGSLYVRREDRLVFVVAQNDRTPPPESLPELTLAVDHTSLAGLAAQDRRTLNVSDVPAHSSHRHEAAEAFAYPVHAMLVVPLMDRHGEVVGVLQLMNPLDEMGVLSSYTDQDAWLCGVLGSHAATAMSISGLHAELTGVFDAIVRYSAAAVDGRDPSTAGHSSRVAAISRLVAVELGGFSKSALRELRFAGILHDVGKIGVRERVLMKSARLEPDDMAALDLRFSAAAEAWIGRAMERSFGDLASPLVLGARRRAMALVEDYNFIQATTRASWLNEADIARVRWLADQRYTDWRGAERPLLRPEEVEALCVQKGTLTAQERVQVQEHVSLSYRFLRQIPFPSDLAAVPELVWSHHERIDGRGYPRGLRGDQIQPGARILAAVDVFDALTAADRPYKSAMSPQRAVQIIARESELGAWCPRVTEALDSLVRSGRIRARANLDEPESDIERDVWNLAAGVSP